MKEQIAVAKKEIERADANIVKIEGLIQSETERDTTATAEADTMRTELEAGESELALARVDGVNPKELAARAKELGALKVAMDAKVAEAGSAAMAVKGLKTRLEQAKTHLEECHLFYHRTAEQVIIAEAERVGAEYLEKSLEVRALHGRLLALDSLQRTALQHQDLGHRPSLGYFARGEEVNVSNFNLKCFEGFTKPYTRPAEFGEHVAQVREELGIETFGRRPPRHLAIGRVDSPCGEVASLSAGPNIAQIVG